MNEVHIPINVAIVGIIGVLTLVIAIILLLIKNRNRIADLNLAGFFFSLSIGYSLQIPHYGYFYESIPWRVLAYPFNFLATMFLYFFVQSSLQRNFNLKKAWVLTVPFIIAFTLAIAIVAKWIPSSMEALIDGFAGFLAIESFIIWLTLLNLRTISSYKRYLSQNYTDYSFHRYQWIRFIVIASLIFSIFPLIYGLFAHISNIPIESQLSYIIAGIITVTYFLLVLIKTIQNANKTIPISNEDLSTKPLPNQDKSPTSEQLQVFKEIEEMLKRSKLYTEPDLNLDRLSEKLGRAKREVSASINICSKRNFYEYINDLRIAETKTILASNPDPKLTIMEVMYDVGYNSKSSFNTAFKHRMNMTPLQFRRKKLQEMSSNA